MPEANAMDDAEIKAYKRRLYVEANREKVTAYLKAWQQANREKCRETMRRYYQRNKATMIANAKAWQKANPDKIKAYHKARYLKRKAARLNPPSNPTNNA
jgi:ABC-type nitrate/sulfonate/bicarbonate transport system substrate-binding protein